MADDDFIDDVWGRRAEGLPAPGVDLIETVRHEDVEYVKETRYPFLQLISTEPEFPDVIVPKFYTAKSGWDIHDYGAAMSSSPGQHLFGPGNPELEDEDEGGAGGIIPEGRGTIINQIYDTAEAMVQLAKDKGWPGVEIIAGTEHMKWAAWVAAEERGMVFRGFEATEEDKERRDRLKKLRAERHLGEGAAYKPGAKGR